MAQEHRVRRTSIWVTTTYIAEGLPYMLVRYLAGVYFTDIGIKESIIGFLNFLGLPWNFKFLWAPLVDFYGTRRGWMVVLQLLIAAVTGLVAVLAGFRTACAERLLLSQSRASNGMT